MVLGTEQVPWSPMTLLRHCFVVLQCAGSWADPVIFFDITLVFLKWIIKLKRLVQIFFLRRP